MPRRCLLRDIYNKGKMPKLEVKEGGRHLLEGGVFQELTVHHFTEIIHTPCTLMEIYIHTPHVMTYTKFTEMCTTFTGQDY